MNNKKRGELLNIAIFTEDSSVLEAWQKEQTRVLGPLNQKFAEAKAKGQEVPALVADQREEAMFIQSICNEVRILRRDGVNQPDVDLFEHYGAERPEVAAPAA